MGDLGQINQMYFHAKSDDDLRSAVCKSNVVINLIGRLNYTRNFTHDDCHRDIPQRIAKASKEEGVEKLIHISCIGADENSHGEFYRSKKRGEDAVKAEFPTATIVRPAHAFGTEDHLLREIALMSKKMPAIPVWAGGSAKLQPVHAQDIALGIKELILDDRTDGHLWHFGGPDIMPFRSIVDNVLSTLRSETGSVNVPGWMGRAMTYPREVLQPYSPFPIPASTLLSHEFIASLREDAEYTVPEGANTLADLGIEPRPMSGLAIDFLRTFREEGYVAGERPEAG